MIGYTALSCNENPEEKENHQYTEHLSNQPAIARYPRPVLQQLSLRTLHVIYHIFGVGIDSLDHFNLFRNHRCQLSKNASKFTNRPFNGLDCFASLLNVCILRLSFFHHQYLLITNWIQG